MQTFCKKIHLPLLQTAKIWGVKATCCLFIFALRSSARWIFLQNVSILLGHETAQTYADLVYHVSIKMANKLFQNWTEFKNGELALLCQTDNCQTSLHVHKSVYKSVHHYWPRAQTKTQSPQQSGQSYQQG
jgi:hypothetical protein